MHTTNDPFYGTYMPSLQNLERTVLHTLQQMLSHIAQDDAHAPAEHICSRIKSAKSVQEKLKKRGLAPTAQQALTQLSDVVGLRVVTHFIGDVYTILNEIQQYKTWEIVKIKDYIANPKSNGYRSLHVILRVPFSEETIPTLQIEVQLRTIAMDCWASLEHQMKYKKHISNEVLIREELLRCAGEIAATDLTMQTIRDMIQQKDTNTKGETL